jgi:hypothetical protein
VDVALGPTLTTLGPGLELVSRGRLRCGADPGRAAVVLVPPCGPGQLRRLRRDLPPSAHLVVVDRRGACSPRLVAELLDSGASTVVIGANHAVLVAYLEAVTRRPPGPPVTAAWSPTLPVILPGGHPRRGAAADRPSAVAAAP